MFSEKLKARLLNDCCRIQLTALSASETMIDLFSLSINWKALFLKPYSSLKYSGFNEVSSFLSRYLLR